MNFTGSTSTDFDENPKKIHFSLYESVQQLTKKAVYSLTFLEPKKNSNTDDASLSKTANTRTLILATCSHRNLVLYRITTDTTVSESFDSDNHVREASTKSQRIEDKNMQHQSCIHYCYVDTDENEEYYACAFVGRIPNASVRNDSTQLICVGGKNARILVIDYLRHQVTRTLSGHGGEILDLQTCPTDEWLLLSASQDYSCRLWNVRAVHDAPIAIFSGHNGHGDGVTTISWHISGAQFVSGGIDNIVKIWDISNDIRDAIVSSNNFSDSVLRSSTVTNTAEWIATVIIQFPIFSTNRMHVHCVDCVEFLGDLIVSKSTENVVQLWYPIVQNKKSPFGDILQPPSSDAILLRTFHFNDGELWYIRFAIEPRLKLLAVGTSRGTITIWTIGDESYQSVVKPIRNLHVNCQKTIRCVRFSPDGSMLFASTDDGLIYQWYLSFE
jgi:polycomb protein EED